MTHDPYHDPPSHDPSADAEPEDSGVECPSCRSVGGQWAIIKLRWVSQTYWKPCIECHGRGRIYMKTPDTGTGGLP